MPEFSIKKPTLAYFHDVFMSAAAFMLAMYMRIGSHFIKDFSTYEESILIGLPVILVISAFVFRVFGLYRGIWRYASVRDLVQLAKATTTITLLFVLVMFLLNRLDPIPRSVPLIQWFTLLTLLGGPRFLYRVLKDWRLSMALQNADPSRVPVLLAGAGDGAEIFIRSISADPHAGYRVVGILDEKLNRVGRDLHGVPILGTLDELETTVAGLKARGISPQRLIITTLNHRLDGSRLRRLFDQCSRLGLALGRLPSLTEFKEAAGEGKIDLRPIAVHDLLGRPQTRLDRAAILGLVGGRCVAVTGAGGTIGGELSRQIAALAPARLLLVESSEFNLYAIDLELQERSPAVERVRVLCDVRDRAAVNALFDRYRPDLVFHAAALKHVPLVEENPLEGILTNAIGTRIVADACHRCGTQAMVLISTDKAVRPGSVMGASKRFAESYVQSLDLRALQESGGPGPGEGPVMAPVTAPGVTQGVTQGSGSGSGRESGHGNGRTRFMTVRFGNVLGSSGSVVPLFERQLRRGGPLTVTHPDMRRYFMTVEEAVQLVLQASAHGVDRSGQRGKIFVLDMGEPVRIVDLARQMIRLAGLRPEIDIRIEFTGLRPGEKLFEELLNEQEAPSRTMDEGVFIAAPHVIDYAFIARAAQELETAARTGDRTRALHLLATVVPDFRRETADPAQRVQG